MTASYLPSEASPKYTKAPELILKHRSGTIILYGLWFGLVTGFVETTYFVFKKVVLGTFVSMGVHFVWMTPLVYALLFTIVGSVCLGMHLLWPNWVNVRKCVSVFAFLSFFSFLSAIPDLHQVAILILAAGIALQIGRLAARHLNLFHTLVRRTVAALLLIVLGSAGVIFGYQDIAERRALAGLPSPPDNAPNVLLLVLDTVRASSLSLYGYERATSPALERIGKRGAVFQTAISTSSWTLPAHGSLFTGRFPSELNAEWLTPLSIKDSTLAEVLQHHGYHTAGFAANTLYCSYEFGLDRGFIHYEDYPVSLGQALMSTTIGRTLIREPRLQRLLQTHDNLGRKSAEEVNRDFLDWLSHLDNERPYFVFLNYFDAHDPYLAPSRLSTRPQNRTMLRFLPELSDLDELTEAQIQELNYSYDGAISYLDYHLGLLFEELERQGELSNTLIVITSDHGEQFGEHGLLHHGNSLYMPLLHVPLIISFPGHVPEGMVVDRPVSLRDIPSTIIDLAGVTESSVPGTPLSHHWSLDEDSPNTKGAVFAEVTQGIFFPSSYPSMIGPLESIVSDSLHLIVNLGNGREKLYNLRRDSLEEDNLIDSQKLSGLLRRLRLKLGNVDATNAHGSPNQDLRTTASHAR